MCKKNERLTLVHITSSLKRGGAEAILCNLVTHLDHTIFDHHVIYFHEGPNCLCLREKGIPIYYVRGLFFRYDFIFFIRLFRLVRRLKPNCIHTLLWAANIAGRCVGRLLGIPVISAVHNNVDQDGVFRMFFDRHTLGWADKLVAVSYGVAKSLRCRDAWLPAHKIEVIPNGIDIQCLDRYYKNPVNRGSLCLTHNHFVIGSVGRFVPIKNYGFLIEQFAVLCVRYTHIHLILIGTGPQESELRAKINKLGIRDRVTLIIDRPALPYYPLFDCFVLTSHKEGISIALLEAMACALPCVVTNAEDEHAVLQSGINGLVGPADSSEVFLDLLTRLIGDASLRLQLGAQARRTVEQFDLSSMVRRYQKLFFDACR